MRTAVCVLSTLSVLCFGATKLVATAPKPPRSSYNKVLDTTYYSSGMLDLSSSIVFSASYGFRGKSPERPKEVLLLFASARSPRGNEDVTNVLQWQGLKMITMRYDNDPFTLPAVPSYGVDDDPVTRALVGLMVTEWLRVKMPVDTFIAMSQSKTEVLLALNGGNYSIKGKSLRRCSELAQTVQPAPASISPETKAPIAP